MEVSVWVPLCEGLPVDMHPPQAEPEKVLRYLCIPWTSLLAKLTQAPE